MFVGTLTEFAVAGGALSTVAVGAYRKLLKPAHAFMTRLGTAIESIEKIEKEVTYNGGGSIKDSVNRIETRLFVQDYKIGIMFDNQDNLAVAELGIDHKVVWVNETYVDWMGLTSDEASDFGFLDAIDQSDRDMVRGRCIEAVDRGVKMNIRFGITNVTTGKRRIVTSETRPLHMRDGQIVKWITAMREVKQYEN